MKKDKKNFAHYDYITAKVIINKLALEDKILSASMGMHEDWFWTGQEIWSKSEGYMHSMNPGDELGGISGSPWATPVLEITFSDNTSETIECYIGSTADGLTKLENIMCWASGCLSSDVQEYRSKIKIKKQGINN